jgi:hypothetical protein
LRIDIAASSRCQASLWHLLEATLSIWRFASYWNVASDLLISKRKYLASGLIKYKRIYQYMDIHLYDKSS